MARKKLKPAFGGALAEADASAPAPALRAVTDRHRLAQAIALAALVPEKRNSIPVLGGLLFTATDDALSIEGTDLDMALSLTLPASVSAPGADIVWAQTLARFAKLLPPTADVTLEGGDSLLALEAGQSRAEFVRLAAPTDWPGMKGPDPLDAKLCAFPIEAGDLRRLLDRTASSISTEVTRYYLNGVYLHAVEDAEGGPVLRAAATDGHRMAVVDTAMPAAARGYAGQIIPTKAVAILRRLLAAMQPEQIVTLTADGVRLRLEGRIGEMAVRFTTKEIDGSFPDYARVIPNGDPLAVIEVEAGPMLRAVKRLTATSTDRIRAVQIEAEQGWPLALSLSDPASGRAREFVEATPSGEAICVGVNSRYLEQMLRQMSGTLRLALTSPGAPFLVVAKTDPATRFLIMPMRVDTEPRALLTLKRAALTADGAALKAA